MRLLSDTPHAAVECQEVFDAENDGIPEEASKTYGGIFSENSKGVIPVFASGFKGLKQGRAVKGLGICS